MSRTFFRKRIDQARAAGTCAERMEEHAPSSKGMPKQEAVNQRPAHATIFDDTDVCRALGLLKREVVKRRTAERRGMDWDVVDGHAGMTAAWIRGWNANADLRCLKPVQPGDGIVTVRVTGRVINGDLVQAERVADGTRVTVRGIRNAWYLHVGDEMDCRMQGGMLAFDTELNKERY